MPQASKMEYNISKKCKQSNILFFPMGRGSCPILQTLSINNSNAIITNKGHSFILVKK